MHSEASSSAPRRLLSPDRSDTSRIFSREDSESLFKHVVACTTGGGDTQVTLRSTWTANLRWGRNRPISSGDTVGQSVLITRFLNGTRSAVELTRFDDTALKSAVQQLERQLTAGAGSDQQPQSHMILAQSGSDQRGLEPLGRQEYLTPSIWSDATFQLSLETLSEVARRSVDPVVAAKFVAAGYTGIGATSWAIFNTRGLSAYAAATGAAYTETVRLPDGSGSGWAGESHADWAKLDAAALSRTALQKCRDSANPFKIEPGRYTAILEPDVVGRMMSFAVEAMDRESAESYRKNVYNLSQGVSKIGYQVFDTRISITSDPTDPDCGFIPFDPDGAPYRKLAWVENGILKELPYNRQYAHKKFGTDTPLPNPMAFRISGGETSIEEMIAATDRGIYVTNTTPLAIDDGPSVTLTAVTRNGLWLIEHGKIVHPIKNLWIYESPMVVFNQVLQLGRPVRTYGARRSAWGGVLRTLPSQALNDGRMPIVAPPMKVKDFNFTRLIDAI